MNATTSGADGGSGSGTASSAPPPQQQQLLTREVFRCDVCHVAQFDDYDEACRHEETCTGAPPGASSSDEENSARTERNNVSYAHAHVDVPSADDSSGVEEEEEESSSSSEAEQSSEKGDAPQVPESVAASSSSSPSTQAAPSTAATMREMFRCDICKVAKFDTWDEACAHEETCTGAPTADTCPVITATSGKEDCSPQQQIEHEPVEQKQDAADDEDLNMKKDGDDDRSSASSSKLSSSGDDEKIDMDMDALNPVEPKQEEDAVLLDDDSMEEATPRPRRNSRRRSSSAQKDRAAAKTKKNKAAGPSPRAVAAAKANPNPRTLAAIFTSPRPTRGGGGGGGGGRGRGGAKGKGGKGAAVGKDETSPGTALLNEHREAEAAAKFAAERKAKAQADRERKRKRSKKDVVVLEDEEKNEEEVFVVGQTSGGDVDMDEVQIVEDGTLKKHKKSAGAKGSRGAQKKPVASIFAARPKKRGAASMSESIAAATSAGPKSMPSSSASSDFAGKVGATNTQSKSAKSKGSSKAQSYPAAPKFPVPSHIVGVNSGAYGGSDIRADSEMCDCGGASKISSEIIASGSSLLTKMSRYQDGGSNEDRRHEPDPFQGSMLCDAIGNLGCSVRDNIDELTRTFASTLSAPPITVDQDEGAETTYGLWSAKHTIKVVPDDVCGESNKETAESLMKFVNEWMAHRAEYVKKMEEKRKSLGSRKRLKKKGGGRSRKDDIWEDSDDEDSGLCNVFHLNGPHGTGKSALVHAVAEQAGCVLVEINTTEKRSGSALKRAIEECTQSHSSLALLKRGANPVLTGFAALQASKNDESQSDSSGDWDSDEEDDEEKGASDRGRLAVILIDEVDNIFENDGDAGFWVALSNLTKKAKCPIILTSCVTPMLLESSTIRYQSAFMARPSPSECASRMMQIARKENIVASAKTDNLADHGIQKRLGRIAELCKCDLRSILNSMQLHSHGVLENVADTTGDKKMDDVGSIEGSLLWLDNPTILDIEPKRVDADSYSVVTIRGNNFELPGDLSTAHVVIGGYPSPAVRVIDANTILAVCPPCHRPNGVDESGTFEHSLDKPCLTCRHVPVVIKLATQTGLILRSDASASSRDAHVANRHFNIEYSFPNLDGRLERICKLREEKRNKRREESAADFSSDEDDFVVPARRSKSVKRKENDASTSDIGREISNVVSMTSETTEESSENYKSVDVDAILENKVKEYLANISAQDESIGTTAEQSQATFKADAVHIRNSQQELDELVKALEYSSDAVLIEDSLTSLAVPSLSGAVRGFGPEFIDQQRSSNNVTTTGKTASKKLRTASAKPPSIERIFASGWNDSAFFFGSSDSYMTLPTKTRDRTELSKACSYQHMIHSNAGSVTKSEADDNSKTSSQSSLFSNFSTSNSNNGNQSEGQPTDDEFLQIDQSSPMQALPSILHNAAELSFGEDLPLLLMRKNETAAEAITLATTLLEDPAMTRSFCFGLDDGAHTGGECLAGLPIGLHNRFSLDYLPALKAMAFAENEADKRFLQLKEKNPDAMGLQKDCNSRRRTTRSSRKQGRDHYFDKFIDAHGRGLSFDCVTALSKRTSRALSKALLPVDS